MLILGPALYVAGNLLFKRATAGRWPLSHLVGLGLFAVLIPLAPLLSPLWLSLASTVALLTVAGWETASLRGWLSPARAAR